MFMSMSMSPLVAVDERYNKHMGSLLEQIQPKHDFQINTLTGGIIEHHVRNTSILLPCKINKEEGRVNT